MYCSEEREKEKVNMENEEEFIPRNYQVALLEKCIKANTIIFLPTGAGKTFIAIMAMKRMGADLLGENHKISIILVNTVALVDQHTKYVKQHTSFECAGFSGEMNVDFWKPEIWQKQFEKNQVLIMTCEILAGIVRGRIFDLNRVNLLIFDECHHAVNDHSMRQLMINFQNLHEPPRVIGLTATLLNGNCTPGMVMEEVKSLEVTFHAKVATVDGLELVVGYATNPNEDLKPYRSHVPSRVEIDCMEKLDQMIQNLSQVKILDEEISDRLKNTNLKPLEPTDGMRKVVNILKDLKIHLDVFGVFGGRIACLAHNIQIERMKKHCNNVVMAYILNYIQTILGYITSRLTKEMASCSTDKERFWRFASDKTLKLIEVLDEFKKNSEENLCGLIFVERRFTAKVVYHILDALSRCDSNYSYIRSDFIIGNNNNPLNDTRENLYISKKNKQVLERFVNKEVNLLCTSQVLEEGIDIPKCTLVCKFDPPKDYRSYIQSKGRARHKMSYYYMLVGDNAIRKFKQRYEEFRCIEDLLNDYLIGKNDERKAPSQKEIEDMYNDGLLPPYYVDGPNSAYISAVSAITLLSRYCQSLPSDQYTEYSPEWYIQSIQDPKKKGLCVVTVLLPIVCPIIDEIEGIPMPNKKWAKRAAAYKACIKLYKCGELDDTLMPRKRNVLDEDVSFLFTHHPKTKEEGAGLRMMRMHDIQNPKATCGKIIAGSTVYLHIINLEPLFKRLDGNIYSSTLYDMYTSDLCFGILTPNPLPPTCNFPTYISSGTIMVSITNNVRSMMLSDEEIEKIKEFHFVLFNDVLEVLGSFLILDVSDGAESMLVVPVRKDELRVDFEVIEGHRKIKSRESVLNHSEKLALVVNDDTFLHRIVMPTYRRDVTTYLVVKVCEDMCPTSDFPDDGYQDFCDYYMEKYNEHIVNREQPMVLVKGLAGVKNVYKPEGLEKKRKKEKVHEELEEYLVPEMLVKQEFPAALWVQGRLLPTILSRLSFILRVEELWRRIGEDCGFTLTQNNMKPLQLNMNLITYDPSLGDIEQSHKKKYEDKGSVPALPSSLKSTCNKDFQAKILESRYPWKDLEEPKDINRSLEVSVMDIEAYENFIDHKVLLEERRDVYKSPVKVKYPALTYNKKFVQKSIQILSENPNGIVELVDVYEAMTTSKANDIVNLERLETLGDSFLKYIVSFYITLRFPKYDEGRATELKGRLISNKNLFYLARKHNLGGIMKNRDFKPKGEWVPPGFCIPEQIRNGISENTISVSCLFKCTFARQDRISGVIGDELMDPIIAEYAVNGEEDNAFQNMDQFLKQQFLRDKCVADVIESLLGTYLQNTGIEGCLKVIHWIGIIPASENLHELLKSSPPNPCMKPNATLSDILYHLPLCDEIEEIIGYRFKNKAFLLEAFTHASYGANRVTKSYEKLEFLGDAILDFLVTCFIYESCGHLTPGELTDLRSALVNNNTFASYVVRLGLHKYLLMMNSKLQGHIDKFVDFLTIKNFEIDEEVLILLEEDNLNLAEYVDVPKVLGDIFEAVAGAVFLDSGYSLETVWRVFYKIMWREIDSFSRNVPKNMVRRLFESTGAFPDFRDAVPTHNGRVMVKLFFHAQGIPKYVYGFGSNKSLAKKAAAKIALRYL